jgi:hypothetical protein
MALNNAQVTIGTNDGVSTWNVSSYVVNVNVNLGKNRILDSFQPGSATIVLKNFGREFDPTNTSSAFYGSAVPRSTYVYVSITGMGRIFNGFVDDWSFNYDVSGESTATLIATEGSGLFARQNIFSSSFPAELSGARVLRVLQDAGVAFENPFGPVLAPYDLDPGTKMLDADTTCKGANALEYLSKIETAEQGALYYNSDGTFVFDDASYPVTTSILDVQRFFTDDATSGAYPYVDIDVSYSSDLLYNRISVTPTGGTARIAVDTASGSAYNNSQLDVTDILYADADDLDYLANYLISKYREPQYRFNSVTVNFLSLSASLQNDLISRVAINSGCRVKFTPNNTGSAIERYVRVIGITHDVGVGDHLITFNFESLPIVPLVLDDTTFGKLDTASLGF